MVERLQRSVMMQKGAVKSEFEAGLRHATTGKLSVTPAINRIREG